MRMNCAIRGMIVMMVLSLGARVAAGKWVKVFEGEDYGGIDNPMVANNCLWYANSQGIGRIFLPTSDFRFFKSSSLNIDMSSVSPVDIRAVDSGQAAFYLYTQKAFFIYNSGVWTKLPFPEPVNDFQLDSAGNLRIASVGALYRCNYRKGDSVSIEFNLNDVEFGKFMTDDSGAIWITQYFNGHHLYRFKGSQLQKIGSKSSDYFILLKDNKGKLRIRTETALLSVENNRLVTDLVLKNAKNDCYSAIDSSGNLWYYESTTEKTALVRVPLSHPDSIVRYTDLVYNKIFPGSGGIIAAGGGAFWRFSSEKKDGDYTSLRALLGNSCGNISLQGWPVFLFEQDNSFLLESGTFIRHKNGACYDLPLIPGNPNCLLNLANGTITAGTDNGLYYLNNSQWTKDSVLGNVALKKIIQDKNGRIWGISDDFIFRQKDSLWEQIDSRNANIPSPAKFQFLGVTSDNSIWVKMSGTVAKTVDGHTWTIFDRTNSVLPKDSILSMSIDKNDHISVVWKEKYNWTTLNHEIVQAYYSGSSWVVEDTVMIPGKNTAQSPDLIFKDSRGDLWIAAITDGVKLLQFSGSKVILHDSTNSPFSIGAIVAEDPSGRLYATTTSGFMAFVPDSVNATLTSSDRVSNVSASFTLCKIGAKYISADYTIKVPGMVSLALFSPQGRCVQALAAGFHAKGSFRLKSKLACAKGVYFVRLNTQEGMLINKVVIK